jgi:CAAX prenyl protease-like protein
MSEAILPLPSQVQSKPLARWVSVLEVFAAWGLIEATTWTHGRTQSGLFWISAAFIFVSTIARRPRLRDLGLGLHGLRSTLWVIPAAIAISGIAGLIAQHLGTLHPLFGVIGIATHSFAYFIWAIVQQFILQSYFFVRLEQLLSSRLTAIASTVLFTLVHIPNPVLMSVCFFAGWAACEIFRRQRNIYCLGVAHAILGLTIAVTVPNHIQRHMRVGIGYFHYHSQTEIPPKA